MDAGQRPKTLLDFLTNIKMAMKGSNSKLDKVLMQLSNKGITPDSIVKAPGRANIIGEHIDYCDGWVLPFAIEQSMYFVAKRKWGGVVTIVSYDYDSEWKEGQEIAADWMGYFRQVLAAVRRRKLPIEGCDVYVTSDIPIGAGVSSSSALCCGFLFLLKDLNNWPLDREALIQLASEAEYGLGLRGGQMDQYAVFYGEEGRAILLDCIGHNFETIEIDQEVFRFMLIDSGVQHSLVSSEYNSRRAEVERALELVREKDSEVTYRTIDFQHLNLLEQQSIEHKRLRHVYSEIQRVGLAVEAISQKDPVRLGQLLFESHYSLRDDYEVSCQEIDWLIAYLEKDADVLGARIMGGGFGGALICLMKENGFRQFEKLERQYKSTFGKQLRLHSIRCSEGVTMQVD